MDQSSLAVPVVPMGKSSDDGKIATKLKSSIGELGLSQYLVGKSLELAFHKTKENPHLSAKVRENAIAARTAQELSLHLMKGCTLTSQHVVESLIPDAREFVDLNESELVDTTIKEIIDIAKELEKKATVASDRYTKLGFGVQKDMWNLELGQKEHRDEKAEYQKLKKLTEDSRLKTEKNIKMRQEKDVHINQDIEVLRRIIDETNEEMEAETEERMKKVKKAAFVPMLGWVVAGVQLVVDHVQTDRKKEAKQTKSSPVIGKMEDKKQLQQELEKDKENLTEMESAIDELEHLISESDRCEDVLENTLKHLGESYVHVTKMATFWGNVANIFEYLRRGSDASQELVTFIHKEAIAKMFKDKLDETQEKFTLFREACRNFCLICDGHPDFSIESVYAFLDGRPADENIIQSIELNTDYPPIL